MIIDNCVHPSYRDALNKYFEDACKKGGQTRICWVRPCSGTSTWKNAVTCSRASDPKKPPAPAGGFRLGLRRPAPVSDAFPLPTHRLVFLPRRMAGASSESCSFRLIDKPDFTVAAELPGASCNPVLAGPATMTQIPERILVQAHLAAKQPQPLTPEQEASCAAKSLPS